jgi:hypothetical protein
MRDFAVNGVRWVVLVLVAYSGWTSSSDRAAAQQEPTNKPRAVDQLRLQQESVADKYAKLEKLLDDMARIEGVTNPQRAALLMQALRQSKERLTTVKLNSVVRLLSQEQLNRALENQREAHDDMKSLLELLLTENRPDRLKREQDRLRDYIKEVERILRLQRSVQGRTEGGGDLSDLSKDQEKIAERTGDLADRIRENEESGAEGQPGEGQPGEGQPGEGQPGEGQPGEGQPGEGQPGEGQPGEGQPGEGQPGEGQPGEGQPGEGQLGEGQPGEGQPGEGQPGEGQPGEGQPGEGQPGEGQPGEGQPGEGQPGEGQPGEGQPGEGQPGEGQPGDEGAPPPQQQDENPARKRIEAAEQRMRQAQQRLEEAERKDAVEEQERAREELEAAKAELERILRQLREEEVERMLALLEGRFRKMLEAQIRIYDDTVQLDRVPDDEKDARVPIPAGRLATEERKLVVEADRALNLLLDEGSSIAFPETVSQLRDDMQQVAERLDAANVGRVTQSIEEDIIASLEEMIEALQKAQKDMEEQRLNPPPMPPGEPQDQPLVDAIAELKMIRALQMRVNMRTNRYARLLDDIDDPVGQATEQELVDALARLAERQERIYQITRGLVLGKNR